VDSLTPHSLKIRSITNNTTKQHNQAHNGDTATNKINLAALSMAESVAIAVQLGGVAAEGGER